MWQRLALVQQKCVFGGTVVLQLPVIGEFSGSRYRLHLIGSICCAAVIGIPVADLLIPGSDILLPLYAIPLLIGVRFLRVRGALIVAGTAALAQLGRGLIEHEPAMAILAAVGTVFAIAALARTGLPQRTRAATAVLLDGAQLSPPINLLSRREREIVLLTLDGWTAPRIAASLFISKRTVETHLGKAYQKLGVASKLELVSRRMELTKPRERASARR